MNPLLPRTHDNLVPAVGALRIATDRSKNDTKLAARKTFKAPTTQVQDDCSGITADDTRPTTVATILVGTLSVDQSSITADTAALLQAQHEEMQAKLVAQAQFKDYIQSIQQTIPPHLNPPNPNLTSGTAHNHGGGPII
jgi:hypothetical protein